jgi:hypothetical protein
VQKGFIANQLNLQANGPQNLGANSFISNSQTKVQNKLNFANEFVKVQQEAKSHRDNQNFNQQLDNQNFNPKETSSKTHNPISQNFASGFANQFEQAVHKDIKQLRDEEVFKETQKNLYREEANKDSQELHAKYNSSETTMANAVQEHHKQVTEAVKEGNVSEQQAAYDHSRERKKQLANWEELAPRIIEDPKNKAVRIDIPGLGDLETIIVRIKQGEVSIQTVGEKHTMEKLQSNEAALSKKLREHNIQLGTLQTFDSALVASGSRQKQA